LKGGETIKLSTIEGRVVSEMINGDLTKVTVDVNDFKSGVYLLTVNGETTRFQEKIIINK
jgi:hypothetical protein